MTLVCARTGAVDSAKNPTDSSNCFTFIERASRPELVLGAEGATRPDSSSTKMAAGRSEQVPVRWRNRRRFLRRRFDRAGPISHDGDGKRISRIARRTGFSPPRAVAIRAGHEQPDEAAATVGQI
ncbi:hypothetical protein [Methylobacterium oryzisoli]|uniref:hypothetical protein n=1 Tax=Methylobacterium oryzisoli TaxID=3385502 RepID=UPI0038917217